MPAACFFRPQNSLEVALALRIVTTLQATFAVRSGGHNANPGFSSVGQQGIVLDLGALNQLTFNGDKSTVSFGPGNTWDKVYGAVGGFNLTVAGGRAAGVGVGGLLLGGLLAPI
jgi:FAD/FMN-containing dehydrogenase